MKKNNVLKIALTGFVLVLVVAVVGLACSSLTPPVHAVEQSIPDVQIPH